MKNQIEQMLLLQDIIATTFAFSSFQSHSHHHICQASSLFSFTFWFSPHVNFWWKVRGHCHYLHSLPHVVLWPTDQVKIFDGKWEDIVIIFTLYPTWSCDQQTKWKDIWVKSFDGWPWGKLSLKWLVSTKMVPTIPFSHHCTYIRLL